MKGHRHSVSKISERAFLTFIWSACLLCKGHNSLAELPHSKDQIAAAEALVKVDSPLVFILMQRMTQVKLPFCLLDFN